MGKQAQLYWKESIPFVLFSGETINVNFLCCCFRIPDSGLTGFLPKTQDKLFSFLDEAFETFGGVPDEIVTDNMKTVMDEARTEY